MKQRAKWFTGLIAGFVIALAVVVFAGLDGIDYLGLVSGTNRVYLEVETDDVLNITATRAGIGTARPTGVTKTYAFDYGNDTFGDQWVPVVNDTDLVFTPYKDFILDQVRFCSDFGAGDTVITNLYVGTTASFTLVSGPDTLINSSKSCETVDLTGVSVATRDIDASASQGWALHVDEQGTITGALALFDGREYDVQ